MDVMKVAAMIGLEVDVIFTIKRRHGLAEFNRIV
jgi:hypothetical protein